jgi:putative PIN family toxin of toxin-antitoxin system
MTAPEDAPAVVLDTNVVLDWLVFGDARVTPLAQAIEAGRLRWVGSARMRAELAHVLGRAMFEAWEHDAEQVLTIVDTHVQTYDEPPACPLTCRDEDDQVFIDLALAQRAAWLFTRDKALLRLARQARLRGTTICPPDGWT